MSTVFSDYETFTTQDVAAFTDPARVDERADLARRIVQQLQLNQFLVITLTDEEKAIFSEGYERSREFFQSSDRIKAQYDARKDPCKAEMFGEHGYTTRESFSGAVGERQCFSFVSGQAAGRSGILPAMNEGQKDFGEVMNRIFAFNEPLHNSLLSGVATYFNGNAVSFSPYVEEHPGHRQRALRYQGDDYIGPHVDVSLLTLLHTTGDGLNLKSRDRSKNFAVSGDMGRLIVIPGETLQKVTGGLIAATSHEVDLKGGEDKQSFAFLGDVSAKRSPQAHDEMVEGFNISL